MNPTTSIYEFTAIDINGQEVALSTYKDKVLLIVNVASKCGFTKQYAGLQDLYNAYRDRGLVILGFPCNQFGGQEPGREAEIKQFCQLNYNIAFPLFTKIKVNGPDTHPLYQYLKTAAPGILNSTAIKWNFTKFLVNRNGQAVTRFAPNADTDTLKPDIEKLLVC